MPVITVQPADEDEADEAALAARITALEEAAVTRDTRITTLEGTTAAQATTITDLQGTVATLETSNADLAATVATLAARVALYDQAAAAVKAILDTVPGS